MNALARYLKLVGLAVLVSVSCIAFLPVSSAQVNRQMVRPFVTVTVIPLRDDSGAVRGRLTLRRKGGVLTYDVADDQGNSYSAAGAAPAQSAPAPLPALPPSGYQKKQDVSDDVKKVRDDLDRVNNNLNAVIARVNQLSAER